MAGKSRKGKKARGSAAGEISSLALEVERMKRKKGLTTEEKKERRNRVHKRRLDRQEVKKKEKLQEEKGNSMKEHQMYPFFIYKRLVYNRNPLQRVSVFLIMIATVDYAASVCCPAQTTVLNVGGSNNLSLSSFISAPPSFRRGNRKFPHSLWENQPPIKNGLFF
jgi:hypothetical protein